MYSVGLFQKRSKDTEQKEESQNNKLKDAKAPCKAAAITLQDYEQPCHD